MTEYTIKSQIVEFGRPNKNNRVYTQKCFENISGQTFVYGELDGPEKDHIPIGVAQLSVNETGVHADITFTEQGEFFFEAMKLGLVQAVTSGYGDLKPLPDGTYEVTDYEFKHIGITNDSAWSK